MKGDPMHGGMVQAEVTACANVGRCGNHDLCLKNLSRTSESLGVHSWASPHTTIILWGRGSRLSHINKLLGDFSQEV